ncbi:MAG: hypothetical protein ACE5PM_04525 [Candidatus Hydrothermarchaeales archaeon]
MSKILAFHELENIMAVTLKGKTLEEKKKILLDVWGKIESLISPMDMEYKIPQDIHELNSIFKKIKVFSRIFEDLIQPGIGKEVSRVLHKLEINNTIPALKVKRIDIMESKLFGEEDVEGKVLPGRKSPTYATLTLDPLIKDKLKKYFLKRIEEAEPELLMDENLADILSARIERDVEKLIEVDEKNAYHSMDYGYVKPDSRSLSEYILKASKESIDWLIGHGLILEEIAGALESTKK